jgi:hypothetical protein
MIRKGQKMKQLIVAACVVLCMATVSQALNFSVMAGEDEAIVRLGTQTNFYDIEAGVQVNGLLDTTGSRVDDVEWEETLLGLYALKAWGPAYVGLFGVSSIDSTDDAIVWGGMLGLRAEILPQLFVVGEYQYQMLSGLARDALGQDRVKAYAGLQLGPLRW